MPATAPRRRGMLGDATFWVRSEVNTVRRPLPEAQVAVDETEFSEFFASQYGRLCWLGLLLTGNRAEAEELAQEALVRTWWRWKLCGGPRTLAATPAGCW